MVKSIALLSQISRQKIVVIGDLMLDSYTIGKASRISPEAPVAILRVQKEHSLPGGAGNVALNLISLGQQVAACGRYGEDQAGSLLVQELAAEQVDVSALYVEKGYMTPIKNRVIADNQQMIRIDREEVSSLSRALEAQMRDDLPSILQGAQMIALSDYGKGLLSRSFLRALIDEAARQQIFIIADPKGNDFSKYQGVNVLKPNLKEAYAAAQLPLEAPLDEVAEKILAQTAIESLVITRSEAGISIFDRQGRRDFPVEVKEVKDVTGAGDTVLAALSASLASNLTLDQAVEMANVAASLAVEHVGCARITLDQIATRLLDTHAHHKLIDAAHASTLHFALKNRPHTILELADDTLFDQSLYQKIKAHKQNSTHTLIVHVPAHLKNPYLVPMLASLSEVDYVLQPEGVSQGGEK